MDASKALRLDLPRAVAEEPSPFLPKTLPAERTNTVPLLRRETPFPHMSSGSALHPAWK